MSNPYSVRVGRDDEYVRGRGIQQFKYIDSVMKTNTFDMYIDHGSLSDYIKMGHFVMLYHNQERIFKGRVLGVDEDDNGIKISGNDMMVQFPNIFVDAHYPSWAHPTGINLKKLIYDLVHKTSDKRHADYIDADTFVRPTNYNSWWEINDKPLMQVLKSLVPSSQDPSGFRRNTFFLDAYSNLYVEPIGSGGLFKGAIDVQKRKIGAKVDGSFCNYAVFKGSKAVPEPANRDSWTELSVDEWRGGTSIVDDIAESRVNAASIKCTGSGSTYTELYFGDFGFGSRDYTFADFMELHIKVKRSSGSEIIDLAKSRFAFWDGIDENATADFDENVSGVTTIPDDTWVKLRIPITDTVDGPADEVITLVIRIEYPTYTGSREVWVDGFFVERSERISTQKNLTSIKTFGMFEKRKRDSNFTLNEEVVIAAQALLNPYPKMKYLITAKGYVPIRLNQTIGVRWKEVDWVLPLTQKAVTMLGAITSTVLTFGGIPLSADDVASALAAESRTETYGKIVRHRHELAAGDDPLNQESVGSDDGTGEFRPLALPIDNYGGRSGGLIAKSIDAYMDWDEYNRYGG